MSQFDLHSFKTSQDLADAAAADFLRELGSRRAPCSVALSGGRIARGFLSAVRDQAKAGGLALSAVHFFWGDERCVPPDDAESNYRLAAECLLGPVGIAPERIHRLRGEAPPELAAAEGESEIRRVVAPGGGGQPVLDLVLLGMGEDGHVASLFPGEGEEAMASPAVYRAVHSAPKPPPRRITLGYPAIVAAQQVWVLASGPGKKQALSEALQFAGGTPLARVLRMREQTRVLTDIL